MASKTSVLQAIRRLASPAGRAGQARFGIRGIRNYGLTQPQIKAIARGAGRDHALALALWDTGIHEARHVATLVADPAQVTGALMDRWLRDFNSWDIVDGCCNNLFRHSPLAYRKAAAWTRRTKEFEKRAGFTLMACLAVHDKQAPDRLFERFLPLIEAQASDDRNFVKKAVNWALRQIGKRNRRLCDRAIATARRLRTRDDAAARWIAADALRELERYRREGKIKDVGRP